MNFPLAKLGFIMKNSGTNASIISASLKTCALAQLTLLCCTNETKNCKGGKSLYICSNTNGKCTTTAAWKARAQHDRHNSFLSHSYSASPSLKHCVLSKVIGHLIGYALLCTHTAGESKTGINVFLYNFDNL